jgi:hypothetical protein
MTGLEELRAYLAKIHHKQLPLLERATAEQLLAVAEAARNLDVRWRERDPETMISMNFRMAVRRLEDALAPLLEDSKGPVATQAGANPHDYLSTACFHGLHERCQRHCKFCGVDCRCTCHVKAQPAAPGRSQVEASAPGASQWLEGPQNDPGASGEGS